jgi:hypothetical protein
MFKLKLTRRVKLMTLELSGLAVALAGVAHYCWPAAVIAAGLLVALAVERNS